jgi:hypothetical protein
MTRLLRILARIAASVVGSLLGGAVGYLGAWAVAGGFANGDFDSAMILFMVSLPPSFLLGATLGAATGATIVQKVLREGSSFRKAWQGAVAGLLTGVVPAALSPWAVGTIEGWAFFVPMAVACASTAAGAVIGSGWKAKPRDAASPSS